MITIAHTITCFVPVQLFDVNEAFAAQWLSVQRELGLPNDKSNVFGGAIGEPHRTSRPQL